jgi:hypothetical protein
MAATLEMRLDPTRKSMESRDFEAGLRRKIVGQDEAVRAVVDLARARRAWSKPPPKCSLATRAPFPFPRDSRIMEAAANSDGRTIPHIRAIAAAERWPLPPLR